MGLCVIAGAAPALAGPEVYTYAVLHPVYGKIGTLSDTIDRNSETTRIEARLRIMPRRRLTRPRSGPRNAPRRLDPTTAARDCRSFSNPWAISSACEFFVGA